MNCPPPLLQDDERQVPLALVEYALRLIGRIHHAGPEAGAAAQTELQQWRQRAPGHADAVATAQRIWNLTATDAALRERLPLPPTAQQQRRARRRALGILSVAGLAAVAGLAGHRYGLRAQYRSSPHTGHAQTLAHALPDGGTIDLAANAALQIAYHRDRRQVRLLRGEAYFDVAADPRPFTVETDWGRVQVLGTAFSVSAREGRMRVAVARGRVAVWPAGRAGEAPAAILHPGESIESDAQGAGARTAVDADAVADWTRGWLVLRNTPLPEAVARWNDYLPQPLRLAPDPALRRLRLTGTYPLRNPQAFLDSLPAMLPVRIAPASSGVMEIHARR